MPRAELRRTLRQRRRQLSPQQQRLAAQRLLHHLQRTGLMTRRRIALYLPNDGEIDPSFVIDALWQRRKQVYLPVLHPVYSGRLWFLPYRQGDRLVRNRFGIAEPITIGQRANARWGLDAVALPLVGFDAKGRRLGMGGGYYDRTFAFKHTNVHHSRPTLVGLAHACQQVPRLPEASWDVALDYIVTDAAVLRPSITSSI